MNHLDCIYLNQIAQGIVPLDDVVVAFSNLPQSARSETIHQLSLMVHESHPHPSEIVDAISTSGLKRTFTPCVMLSSGDFYQQLSRLGQLPNGELDKAFLLLLHLFRTVDGRRREACGDSCHHWWHQDLSDARVLRELKSRGTRW